MATKPFSKSSLELILKVKFLTLSLFLNNFQKEDRDMLSNNLLYFKNSTWSYIKDCLKISPNILISFTLVFFLFSGFGSEVFALSTLPGDANAIQNLKEAGNLLRIFDSFLFVFGTKLLAGILVLGAGVAIKNHQYASFGMAVAGALVVGLSNKWVKNFIDAGGGKGVISSVIENADYWIYYV